MEGNFPREIYSVCLTARDNILNRIFIAKHKRGIGIYFIVFEYSHWACKYYCLHNYINSV